MTILNFQGPIQICDIKERNDILINYPDLNNPGIYIWGFMYRYDYDKKQGVEPINYKKEEIAFPAEGVQFIPYYVGEITSKISDRIKKHHNIRVPDASKYIRLSHDYMLTFFKDKKFPTHDSTSKKLKKEVDEIIQSDRHEIQYYNNNNSLNNIYPDGIIKTDGHGNHWPITNQLLNNDPMPDNLHDLVYNMNNFWFCYATFKPNNVIVTKPMLLPLETYTYWSLKGKTISKTGKFGQIDQTIRIKDNTNAGIFNKDSKGEVSPSEDFYGY